MSAAQGHADWIVQTGQGGHTGAGGSDETMRVSWTGYGGGAEIKCDENWAMGSNVSDVVYNSWSDWTHQEVMLNSWGNRYTDIGGGVAKSSKGLYVFVLNVCLVVGQSSSGSVPNSAGSTTSGDTSVAATADVSNYIYGVNIATPRADGSIVHIVLYGQSLTSIANAYGVTIDQLRELNGMAANDSTIWTDQELVIAPPGSATQAAGAGNDVDTTPQPTPTIFTATLTPRPTLTPGASPTAQVESERSVWNTRTLGILLLVVSGLGLAAMLYFSTPRK
jgi:LysM repeat protein